MNHPMLALTVIGVALGLTAAGASLLILPKAACNPGTTQAHESIPPALPNGNVTPGRLHVPQIVHGNCTTIRP